MTQVQQPLITQARVEAYVASALRLLWWLAGVILRWGLTGRGARLRHVLSYAERTTESILFLQAVARYGPPPQCERIHRAAPPGFRRVVGQRLALFHKGAKVRARKANALTRVMALLDALAHPEKAVAYFLKRLRQGLRLARLICAAPPQTRLEAAPMLARDVFIDSS